MAGPIAIAVVADVAKARAGLNSVEGDLNGLGGKTSKFGAMAKAGFLAAGAAAVGFAVQAVKAGSDAQQSLGATETVFGKYADTVVADSKRAAQEFGLSANEYRENANLLGSLFKNQGVAMDQLGGKTKDMIGQASDLAATFGGTTKEAVEALGSAFKGEFDPLEKYGISIKQSTINAELAARGQDKLTGAALKQAQQIATTDLIMKQAADTQGAFARESNTLAGQQQRLSASWENIKAQVGSALLPALTALAAVFNETVLPAISAAWTWLSQKLGPVFTQVKGYVDQVTASFGGKGGGLAGAVSTVQEIFGKVVDTVRPIVAALVGLVRDNWDRIVAWTRETFARAQSTIRDGLQAARTVVDTVLGIIRTLWDRFGADVLRIVRTVFETVAGVVRGALNIVQGIFRTITAALTGDWRGAWDGIKQIVRGAVDVVVSIVRGLGGILATVARAAFNLLRDAAQAGVDKAVAAVKALPGLVKSGLGALGSFLYQAGRDLIQGLINGVGDMAGALVDKARGVVDGAISAAKSLLGINSPSRVFADIGRQVGAGLVVGLDGSRAEARRAMGRLVDPSGLDVSLPEFATPANPEDNVAALLRALLAAINGLPRAYRLNERTAVS